MKRLLSIILAVALLIETAPAALTRSGLADFAGSAAYAASVSDDSRFAPVVKVDYKYASNESDVGNILAEDTVRYSDRWFTESSYKVNRHLAALSACAALSTASFYGAEDEKERSHEGNSENVRALLEECGFRDIETNKYYRLEKEQNSMACIVGQKTLNFAGKKYTLLAVMPRSAGYKQEWVGNFTVGKDKLHQGFKAARDEILRFVKNYIAREGIKGDVKIWTTGHSRGGASANMLGGFFAEGGGGYFDGVSISPEDVYCYSFATPRTIKNSGVRKSDALSVEGSRGGRYKSDSEGAGFTYSGTDADTEIKPHEGVYQCVHNCKPGYDIITQLPPEKWGYDWYGVDLPVTDGSAATKARMKEELRKLAPFAYDEYMDGGDEEDFKWKTFDFASLEFVDDTSFQEEISQERFFWQRINDGLAWRADFADSYVEGGYEETLKALAAFYGMGLSQLKGTFKTIDMDLIKAALFTYLAYASERLMEERDINDEKKAIAVAVEELIEYITGEEIDPDTYTVDQFLVTFALYIVDNAEYYEVVPIEDDGQNGQNDGAGNGQNGGTGNGQGQDGNENNGNELDPENYDNIDITVKELKFRSKAAEELFNAISNYIITSIPPEYSAMIAGIIPGYDPAESADSPGNKKAVSEFVFSFLHECAYGTGDKENPEPDEAKDKRAILYFMIQILMSGEDYSDIREAISNNGSGNASALLNAVIKLLMVKEDADGNTVVRYDTVADASEGYLKDAVERLKTAILESGKYDEGSVYYEDVEQHCESLKGHVSELRKIVMDMLLHEKDAEGNSVKFSADRAIRTISTFAAQAGKVAPAHYNELYAAWMKARATTEESRKDVIGALRLLAAENAGKVLDQRGLELTILRAIDAVHEAGDADETEQIFTRAKADVDALIRAKEKADRDAAERAAADTAAAEEVRKKIEALPDPESITTADKEAIEAARAAYDALTAGQKAKISAATLKKLADAETALEAAEEKEKKTAITALVLTGTTYKYNGKVQKPAIAYVIAGDKVVGPDGYDVSYSGGDSIKAGSYTVTVTGKDRYTGTVSEVYTISKVSNPVKIKAKTVSVKYSSISKKARTIKRSKAIAVKKAKGKVTYKLSRVKAAKYKKYFKVSKKTGNIRVRKGLKKGIYRLRISVRAAGSTNYKGKAGTVTVKIRVK